MFNKDYMKCVISAITFLMALTLNAQTFTIVSQEFLPTDLTASTKSRADLNGKKCGLVRVQCVLDGINFAGNIIGDVEHKDGEYWVYMTDGSKQLSVKHDKLLPLDVDFSTISRNGLQSSCTYRLILSIPDALYSSVLASNSGASMQNSQSTTSTAINTTLSGVIKDIEDNEPIMLCFVEIKGTHNVTPTNIDGSFTLNNVKPGSTLTFSYVGYKSKEITFTGKIPKHIDIFLKKGRGTEKEKYFYDPDDTGEYFDLNGNKLSQRPSKKGVYIRIENGKPEKFTIK